jgi:hypothetical protein
MARRDPQGDAWDEKLRGRGHHPVFLLGPPGSGREILCLRCDRRMVFGAGRASGNLRRGRCR